MSKTAEERAFAYQRELGMIDSVSDEHIVARRMGFYDGYRQAEKDIKEAIVKHFKYKQDHSPEHTLHWWVYKNVIDKVNEL